jgi:uncharacterized integral membrane protein
MTDQKKSKSGGYVSWILAALVIIAVLLLFFQNNKDAEIILFFQRITMSLSILIFFCIFLGFLLGLFMIFPGRWRLYRANKRLRKEVEELKETQFISSSQQDDKAI